MVREHAQGLMGRSSGKDFFNQVAMDADVQAYDSKRGECCNYHIQGNFRVHIEGLPRSPWNQSCTRQFVASFMAEHAMAKKSKVETAWIHHFTYLRTVFQKQRADPARRAEIDKVNRRRERKSQVCQYVVSSPLALVLTPYLSSFIIDVMLLPRSSANIPKSPSFNLSLSWVRME